MEGDNVGPKKSEKDRTVSQTKGGGKEKK